jgi:hypothetical protein
MIPIRIIATSMDCIEHARILESPVCDRFQWDNTLGMKLMCKDGNRSGSNVQETILDHSSQFAPIEPKDI